MPDKISGILALCTWRIKIKDLLSYLILWLVVLPWGITAHAGEYPYSPLKANVSNTIFGCSLILFFLVSSFCIFSPSVTDLKQKVNLFTCDNFTLSGLFSLFFHFFINFFFFRFLHTFSILPTTVGNVAGLVVDADGLVTRDVGESDVVVRLVIPGWRRVGRSSFVMSCSLEN